VVGDLDRPDTLPAALEGISRVFLVSPMDRRIADREKAVIAAAVGAGVQQVVKLYGAVRHEGDALDQLHQASIAALRESGLSWALLSPNSVMETSLYSQIPALRATGQLWACAGEGKVGLIAADDVGRAGAAVLSARDTQPTGTNFELTGPQALSMTEIAAVLSTVLDRPIAYQDLPEDDFREMVMAQTSMTADQIEIAMLGHFRAWRHGKADLVTDTYRELAGLEPTTLESWVGEHRSAFT
jgi:uncharacterized protein YbjT (DUF2867 family)